MSANLQKIFEPLRESLAATANVKSVYGEPITVGSKTIIPVARVGYGFGAGSGRRGESSETGEGGGGGGGVGAVPVGVVEITANGTRFVSFGRWKKLLGAFAAGIVVGMIARGR